MSSKNSRSLSYSPDQRKQNQFKVKRSKPKVIIDNIPSFALSSTKNLQNDSFQSSKKKEGIKESKIELALGGSHIFSDLNIQTNRGDDSFGNIHQSNSFVQDNIQNLPSTKLIQQLYSENNQLKEQANFLSKCTEQQNNEIAEKSKRSEFLETELQNAVEEIKFLRKEKLTLEQELTQFQNLYAESQQENRRKENEIESVKQALDTYQNQYSEQLKQNSELAITIQNLKNEVEKCKKEYQELEQTKQNTQMSQHANNNGNNSNNNNQNSSNNETNANNKQFQNEQKNSNSNTNIDMDQISAPDSQLIINDSQYSELSTLFKQKIQVNLAKQEKFIQRFITQKIAKTRSKVEHQFYEQLSQSLQLLKQCTIEMSDELQKAAQQYEDKTKEQQSIFINTLQSIKTLKATTESSIKNLENQYLQKQEESLQFQQQKNQAQLNEQQFKCDNDKYKSLNQKLERQNSEFTSENKELKIKIETLEQNNLQMELTIKDMEYKIKVADDQLTSLQSDSSKQSKEIESLQAEKKQLENVSWDKDKQMQTRNERIQMLENELINEQQQNKLFDNEINKLNKSIEENALIQIHKDKLFSDFQLQHQKITQLNYKLQDDIQKTETKYQKSIIEYKDFHAVKLRLDEQIQLLTEQNQSYLAQLKSLPDRIVNLGNSNEDLSQQLADKKTTMDQQKQQIVELQSTLQQIREKIPLAEDEYKNLLNKEKELVLLNQELQEKNQILIDLNKELGNKNDQINNQLLTYRESSEQSDIKKSIFYQKKANELESRILTLSNDLQKQKDENQKLNQSLLYLNELQQFFDKNYIQIKSNQKNEQQLTDKVKILAKQLELSIKTKIGMDSRIQELEEFILMLLDENQDAPKASQYLNLRNRQVRRSDILKANSENQQPVSYILQGLNKQDKSIKSPQDKFTTKIQLQMQQ